MQKEIIEIHTDGSCINNPGPGGYAFIMVFPDGLECCFSDGYNLTTNNRMELIPLIKALESITPGPSIHVYSDSTYVVKIVNGWLETWKNNQWRKANNKPVENLDLLKKLDMQLQRHSLQAFHVKGHSSNKYNIRCDCLAKQAAQISHLPDDIGYISKITKTKQAA